MFFSLTQLVQFPTEFSFSSFTVHIKPKFHFMAEVPPQYDTSFHSASLKLSFKSQFRCCPCKKAPWVCLVSLLCLPWPYPTWQWCICLSVVCASTCLVISLRVSIIVCPALGTKNRLNNYFLKYLWTVKYFHIPWSPPPASLVFFHFTSLLFQ